VVSSNAKTVDAYIQALPEDRKEALKTIRKVILKNLPKGFEEGMLYGMPAYYVPLKEYPDTYNGQPIGIAAFASQKNYIALYLYIYHDQKVHDWFIREYKAAGKKPDVGKSCVRIKTLDDLPLDLLAETIGLMDKREFIRTYEREREELSAYKKRR
jgi:uncharacterized protein YdhG (YjbR/CyaY superfamily)